MSVIPRSSAPVGPSRRRRRQQDDCLDEFGVAHGELESHGPPERAAHQNCRRGGLRGDRVAENVADLLDNVVRRDVGWGRRQAVPVQVRCDDAAVLGEKWRDQVPVARRAAEPVQAHDRGGAAGPTVVENMRPGGADDSRGRRRPSGLPWSCSNPRLPAPQALPTSGVPRPAPCGDGEGEQTRPCRWVPGGTRTARRRTWR